MGIDLLSVRPASSVTVKTGEKLLSAVGVPERTPVAGSREIPGGRPVASHPYGAVPPDASQNHGVEAGHGLRPARKPS